MKYSAFFTSLLLVFFVAPSAFSNEVPGLAHPWQLGFTDPASPVMEGLYSAHNFLLVIITFISLLVLCLLIYICLRFNRRTNPTPSKTAHNTRLEMIWTIIPVIILVVIAIPSLRLHYFIEDDVEGDVTLKVVGNQWYWHYEYPDHGGFGFDSYMKKQEDLEAGEPRLLAVDNHVVVPVDTKVRVLMTASDVIHAWAVPALGVKRDAVPGRLNSSWFKATKTGTYYGQCSELCGVGHGFMPIRVDVVEKDEFAAWIKGQQKEAGIEPAAAAETVSEELQPVPLRRPVSAEKENPLPEIEKQKKASPDKATTESSPAEQTVLPKGEPVKEKIKKITSKTKELPRKNAPPAEQKKETIKEIKQESEDFEDDKEAQEDEIWVEEGWDRN